MSQPTRSLFRRIELLLLLTLLEMDLLTALGQTLQSLREEKGLSQYQVQSEYGFTRAQISRWENSRIQISMISLHDYSKKVFGMNGWEVFKMAEELLAEHPKKR